MTSTSGVMRLRRAQQLEPGQARHLQIGDDEVDAAGLNCSSAAATVRGEHDPVACARQGPLEALAKPGIVVGDQQGRGLRHAPLA